MSVPNDHTVDDLQFSYQPNCSTTMCSWIIIETFSYFLRNNSEVFTCTMDMTKAFDLCFIQEIVKSRSISHLCKTSACHVCLAKCESFWNGSFSSEFPLQNGVKQGAVLSAILYCIYMNGLFKLMRDRRTGCWIEDNFVGMVGYADDNFLLSPTIFFFSF